MNDKNVTVIRNIKNDISALSLVMYEREKKRETKRENDIKDIKEEIQKHSSINSNVDFSAVITKKLDGF